MLYDVTENDEIVLSFTLPENRFIAAIMTDQSLRAAKVYRGLRNIQPFDILETIGTKPK